MAVSNASPSKDVSVAVLVGKGGWEGVDSDNVGIGIAVMLAVVEGGIGDGIIVSVGMRTAETTVLSVEVTVSSGVLLALSQEVKMMLKMSKKMKFILLVIVWSSSLFV